MKRQLLLCKRIYLEGCEFAERGDPISSGLAISLFQDAVEMFVWTLIKDRDIKVDQKAQFTTNIKSLAEAGIGLSFVANLHELNTARVSFKHYGNLPAVAEAAKFRAYVEEFLRVSFVNHFGMELDYLSLVDLIVFEDVREYLKSCEHSMSLEKYGDAMAEAARAKTILFSKLGRFIPNVGEGLILGEQFRLLREAVLASLVRVPLQDYYYIQQHLPQVHRGPFGGEQVISTRKYDEPDCRRAIECLVSLSIRLESIIA
jgi:hypothetical protein